MYRNIALGGADYAGVGVGFCELRMVDHKSHIGKTRSYKSGQSMKEPMHAKFREKNPDVMEVVNEVQHQMQQY
jgi:hypothetical protein